MSDQGPRRKRDILPPGYETRGARPRPAPAPAPEPVADDVYGGEPYAEEGYDDGAYDEDAYYDDVEGYDDGYDDDGYDDDGYDGHRPDRAHQRRRRHPVLISLVVVFAVLLTVVVAGVVWANDQINPGGHHGPAVSVVIPAGSSTKKIASLLAKAGVIHDATLFTWYTRLNSTGTLYPGTYTLDRNISYKSAISALEAGPKIITEKLVIPEGYTVRQIAAAVGALPQVHLSAQKFLALISSGQVRSPYEPAGQNNLEGLLFPATYEVSQGQTESDVLEQMIGAFDDRAQQIGLTAAATARHMTPYQVVIVASIVEREAKFDGDRGPVASVIYNRLQAGMTLGADSSQTYYLRLTDPTLVPTASQLNQPSPYNTRLNQGLPPTAISNPGLPSLQAAVSPPATNDLYFVEINPDGKLGFASTSAGFAQLEAECQAAGTC